jgi:hypothetical protein
MILSLGELDLLLDVIRDSEYTNKEDKEKLEIIVSKIKTEINVIITHNVYKCL